MFPLRDTSPHKGFPVVNSAIIFFNIWAYIDTLKLSPVQLVLFRMHYGLVPRFSARLLEQNTLAGSLAFLSSLVSYTFVHAGIFHLLGNMWFLWIFGRGVEFRLGHLRYLVFYLLAGIASGYLHIIFNITSDVPCVGASGAISGVIGAYLVLSPRAKILTLVPIYFIIKTFDIPAYIFIVIWLLGQVFGVLTASSAQGTNIAWWAHVGGFVWGFFAILIFIKDTLDVRIE